MIGKFKERGITLIALVVTIIILLILAGVTLNIALSDNGLIKKSQEATEKYKQAQNEEEESLSDLSKLLYSDYVGEYVTGYEPVKVTEAEPFIIKTQTSGTESDQQFTTENLGWRIWDYNGETLRLISDRPTNDTLSLSNVNGYNNGVWAMNEVCRQCYTDKNIPIDYIEIRNLRRSDIEAVSNYDYTTYKHEEDDWQETIEENSSKTYIHYGETVKAKEKYGENTKCPAMWSNHDLNWNYKYDTTSKEGKGTQSCEDPWEKSFDSSEENEEGSVNETTEFKQSGYNHYYRNGEFNNSKYYDLIFKKGDDSDANQYWLAGRYTFLYSNNCGFGLNYINASDEGYLMGGRHTFNSLSTVWELGFGLRPIVSINLKSSGYKLVANDNQNEAKFKLARNSE